MNYSTELNNALAEATTKTEWMDILTTSLGENYKFVGREGSSVIISVTYDGFLATEGFAGKIDFQYDSLFITSGSKSLTWRLESNDGTVWAEWPGPFHLTGTPASGKGFTITQPILLPAPSELPDGEAGDLLLDIPNLVQARGDKVDLLQYVTYPGDTDDLTFTEVTNKLTGYQFIQNLASMKRLWIAINSPASVINGVTIQVSDGVNTAQSTFNITTVVVENMLWWDGFTNTLVRSKTSYLDLSEHVVYHASGTLTYSSIGASLPAGCSLNTSTGKITITSASVATTSGLQFRVTDGTFTEDSPVFALQIVDEVLLQKDNFNWTGAFRVPTPDTGGTDVGTFNYGGSLGCYDPNGNGGAGSIYMYGLDTHANIGEFSIPTPSTSTTDIGSLPRATLIQNLVDATEGTYSSLPLSRMCGAYVVGSELIMTAYQWYGETRDGPTHWLRSKNLSVTGSPGGPKTCVISNYVDDDIGWSDPGSPWTTRPVGGHICKVPTEWQAALGGELLCGVAGMSVVGSTSNGPAIFSFNKAELENTNPKINGLVAYPLAHNLAMKMNVVHQDSDYLASGSRFWSFSSSTRGIVFPEGSDCVILFGTGLTGQYWYGQGSPNGPEPGNEYPWGYTMTGEPQGGHSHGVKWLAWGYRASDLADVHSGAKLHYEITPYAVWELEMPAYDRTELLPYISGFIIDGVGYKESTDQLYVSTLRIEDARPIVHVLDMDY